MVNLIKHLPSRHFYRKLPRPLYGGVAVILILLLILARSAIAPTKVPTLNDSGLNLIAGQDWSHFAGASQDDNSVHISGLGRAIVNQDGSGGQPNPPVNVRGPHLAVNGDFGLTLKASVPSSGPASIYLYGSVPVIYDEWRYESPQIRIDIYNDKITIYEWDGTSDNPIDQKTWQTALGKNAQISLISQSAKLTVESSGSRLGDIPNKGVFNSGQVWFGADAPVDTAGWNLTELSVRPLNQGRVSIESAASLRAKTDNQSLRALASAGPKNLPIGAAVADYALFSDLAYRNLVGSQFSLITPENEMKPQFIHPQPNIYSFKEADSLVDFALANGMKVHGHTLEFSEANPKWMQNSPLADRQKILTDHITTVVSHYGNKINEWDVVDEPLNDNDDNNGNASDLRQNIWTAAMGESYIDTAFKAAHAANPGAKLYINEYGLEADGSRWDEFLSLIKRLQSRGVPIAGVGFQAHVHEQGDEVDTAVLQKHIQTLANMGLASRVSEIDVYGDDAQHQADQYTAALKACLTSPSCTSFTMWGLSDKYGSTTDIHNYPISFGNDLVWDENMQPKAAYNSLQTTLKTY